MTSTDLLDQLVSRCTFPPSGRAVTVALSGGPDSSALTALAVHAGLEVIAIHIDHGLRDSSSTDAEAAKQVAHQLGCEFRVEHADLADGSNLEARARTARRALLPDDVMTGHTTDDQAETLLLALLRGAGATGLAAMRPGPAKPILGLRRSETHELCRALGLATVTDPTNTDPRFRRNRIRSEVMPLLDDVAERDVTRLLARTADLLREDDDLLDSLAATIDATDTQQLRDAHPALARRAVRRWLTVDGAYPPDAAAVERVLDVARLDVEACEIGGGRRVSRTAGRLRLS